MNIILLSGGSGTRLWPLSNEIRSKQFIKLFKTGRDDEPYESMIQRVYRQITTVSPGASVTIATSKSQVSAIKNQLGAKVSVCVEPCRRDTFPAIALAAAFLQDVQGVAPDEPVVVCPVDPYVENSYFEAVSELAKHVAEGKANLTLMGIEPTCPSEKYGYIIPKKPENVSSVSEFKEKPDAKTAKEYIVRGALWNAGVFGFRLGYLIGKAHEMIDFTNYKDLFGRYEDLPKISFDYAVVEKEQNIQVVRYAGDWRDVGTWNTLTEVMEEPTKGNVTMDEACNNTQVVNELEIPILCMGCRDMVIAASGDGILVADKERTDAMKPYVDKINTGARFAEKSWGTFTVLDVQPGAQVVKIQMKAGTHFKYHSHEMRDEIWTVLAGSGRAVVGEQEKKLSPGDAVQMVAGIPHMLYAETDMTVIELQIGQEIAQADKHIV